MAARGVDVQKEAHQREVIEDAAAATSAKQCVGVLGAALNNLRALVAVVQALLDLQHAALLGLRHELIKVAVDDQLHLIDGDHRIGQCDLRRPLVGGLRPHAAGPSAAPFAEAIDRALQAANGRRGHCAHKDLAEGQVIERSGELSAARVSPHKAIAGLVGAVFRHEAALDDDILTARGFEAHGVPSVDDLEVALRQQKGAVLRRLAFLENQAAQEHPIAVVDTAGKPPTARELEAAFDRLHDALGHIGAGDQHIGVARAPDILRGLGVKQGDLPVVDGDHRVHPSGAHAALGQRHGDVVEGLRVHLIAAVFFRLQDAEQASGFHFRDGLSGQHARFVGGFAARSELRE